MSMLSDRLAPTAVRRPAAKETARTSGRRAAIFLTVTVVAALGAGVLFSRYIERRSYATTVPTEKVVVAAVDIPMATTLRAELLTAVDWPRANLPQGALKDPAALAGRVVLGHIIKGEPVLEGKLASDKAGKGLAAVLPETMRAVSVRVDDVVGVAGFIHPGDKVDVIVTMKPEESSDAPPTSKVILQNIKVLAVGKEIDRQGKKADKPVPVTVATLMVSSPESEKLALAATKGKLLLALRGGLDDVVVETPGIIPPVLLEGAPSATPEKAPEKAPAAATPPTAIARRPVAAKPKVSGTPAPGHQVEILRGDRFEKRNFQDEEVRQ